MIGITLRKLRSIYDYSASDLSEKLGISKSYLSEIENGKKQPSLDILQRYSDLMGIKRSSLLLLSEELDDAEKQGKGQDFIADMMRRLIDAMARERHEDI
jgi:transcriptional regulator with XRE-family HTH domain